MKRHIYNKEQGIMPTAANQPARKPLDNQGFTLLEVVIALAIFSVGIMAVASLQVSSTNGDLRARLATEAATAAHDQAERLLSIDYDPDNLTVEFFDTGAYAAFPTPRRYTVGRYTVDWIVAPHTFAEIARAVRVTVVVQWQHFGKGKSYELEFVKIDEI